MTDGKLTNGQHPANTYRVVQWSAGRMGKKSLRAVVDHPDLELVGLYVYSEDKEGVDAGVLAGIEPLGIAATRDIEDIVALAPDCVLYMQEGFDLDDLTRLLGAGINVITTATSSFMAPPWTRRSGRVSRRHATRGAHRYMRRAAAPASAPRRCR